MLKAGRIGGLDRGCRGRAGDPGLLGGGAAGRAGPARRRRLSLANGSEGKPTTIAAESPDACQAQCLTGGNPCVAVEYNANSRRCEVHREPITKFEKVEGVACYVMR